MHFHRLFYRSSTNGEITRSFVLMLCLNYVSLLWQYSLIATASFTFCESFQLSPSTAPGEIIERQLAALRDDDIGAVYKFASPANKEHIGSATDFAKMVRSGPYRYLLGHSRSEILLESKLSASHQFLVRVITSSSIFEEDKDRSYPQDTNGGKVVEYWWSLSRCNKGEFTGSYMVDAVIPNQI
mmetsp:Transcript_646/g.1432  ORF Transcript_646/g.1432 Transcript_646/m.1432 type:complete len:184 (+) Transcript_646:156-707(+)